MFQHFMSTLHHLHFLKGAFVFLQAYGALTFGRYSQTIECNLQWKCDWPSTAGPANHRYIRHLRNWCPAWLSLCQREPAWSVSETVMQGKWIGMANRWRQLLMKGCLFIPHVFTLNFSVSFSNCWRGYRDSGGRSVWCPPITRWERCSLWLINRNPPVAWNT